MTNFVKLELVMAIEKYSKAEQGYGEFNGGAIVENKPIGFPQAGGGGSHPYSNLFYWAKADTVNGSTIGEHPHQAFEILSFVLEGDIEHYDNHNNKWFPLAKGDVQVIKSGSGIYHAEKMNPGSSIFQIWFNPDIQITLNNKAEYTDYKETEFEIVDKSNYSTKIMLGENSPIKLVSEGVEIQEITAKSDFELELDTNRYHSFYVISGEAELNGSKIVQDDFIKISDEVKASFTKQSGLRLFYISNPKVLTYRTYYQSNKSRYQ